MHCFEYEFEQRHEQQITLRSLLVYSRIVIEASFVGIRLLRQSFSQVVGESAGQ
jgi:hypothetical protein